ncbi:hypothetical protein BKA70DRAFT_1428499 [Coprinopsis sp. MPI-PUGE-AT-0042]|nr:hypothetical protein BKA70DRAFT_1428499 [Coprinopsis sp. MPI-PUGE-AT-0042]
MASRTRSGQTTARPASLQNPPARETRSTGGQKEARAPKNASTSKNARRTVSSSGSSSRASTPAAPQDKSISISAKELDLLRKQAKAQNTKAQQAKQTQEMQELNRKRLRDEESGDMSEAEDTTDIENRPPPSTQPSKKSKSRHVQEPEEETRQELSEDELELGDRIFGDQRQSQRDSDDDDEEQQEDHIEEDVASGEGEQGEQLNGQQGTGDQEEGEEEEEEGADNEMLDNGVSRRTVSFGVQDTSSSAPSSLSRKGLKVIRSDFPDDVAILADEAKTAVRTAICFGEWEEIGGRGAQLEWAWRIAQAVAQEQPAWVSLLRKVSSNETMKRNFITYALYARGGFLSTLITKTRAGVAAAYSLSGGKISRSDTEKRVRWLREACHFMYGDLDVEKETYEKTKPFGNPFIKEVIQHVFFAPGNMMKADQRTANRIRQEKAIPPNIILLVVTAIEHAIGEYTSGHVIQVPFKEMRVRGQARYHEKNWVGLTEISEDWTDYYLQALLQAIADDMGLDDLATTRTNTGDDIKDITADDLAFVVASGRSIF